VSKRETNGTLLARIDERLQNLIGTNNKEHADIVGKIDELCKHANHEIDNLNDRVKILENARIAEENKYKGRLQLFKWLSIGLGIIIGVMTILSLAGIF
jgi:capsular polysaccharide biosynthesis protein